MKAEATLIGSRPRGDGDEADFLSESNSLRPQVTGGPPQSGTPGEGGSEVDLPLAARLVKTTVLCFCGRHQSNVDAAISIKTHHTKAM